MDDDQLDNLFGVARTATPGTDSVEHGFETRLMARIGAENEAKGTWHAWIWRLVPAFAVIVAVLAAWSILFEPDVVFNLSEAIMGPLEDTTIPSFFNGG
jgi:hypothetical protein